MPRTACSYLSLKPFLFFLVRGGGLCCYCLLTGRPAQGWGALNKDVVGEEPRWPPPGGPPPPLPSSQAPPPCS